MNMQTPLAGKSERLASLDVFRGLTIAGMILVNNPGSWSAVYGPLKHAPWHGWTPTDWIFPFFLFIVGVAMTFSFDKRIARGASPPELMKQVLVRSAVLFLLGLILSGFPNFRLITPYIFAIAGLQLLLPKLETRQQSGRSLRAAGWFFLTAAIVWFAIDFPYFNGPARRSGFEALFPLSSDGEGSPIRIPGVLQRIALCYAAAAFIMLRAGLIGRLAWALFLLHAYWLVMAHADAPAGYMIGAGAQGIHVDPPENVPFRGRLNDWIDAQLLGEHLYRARPDPEGILSTFPAIATTLLGVLTGMWIQSARHDRVAKAGAMFAAGNALVLVGVGMDLFFPINKKIWTSSYVVFTAGWGLIILAACYYIIDVRGRWRWSLPFKVLGTNAILAFFGSAILIRILGMIQWGEGDDRTSLRAWSFSLLADAFSDPRNASLTWALCYVAAWVLLLTPLYRKQIFLKV